jgi:Fe-S cluster assembly scaffold protein SufB
MPAVQQTIEQTMSEPTWAKVHYPEIDFQNLYYYSAPKSTERPKSLDDSVSVVTTFKEELGKAGVIFCAISEAVRNHPDLVKKYQPIRAMCSMRDCAAICWHSRWRLPPA